MTFSVCSGEAARSFKPNQQRGVSTYTHNPLIGHRHLYLLVITHTASLPRPVFRPSVIKAPQPACTCKRLSAPLQARPPLGLLSAYPHPGFPIRRPFPSSRAGAEAQPGTVGHQLSPDGHLHGECSRRDLCSALPGTGLLRGKNTVQPVRRNAHIVLTPTAAGSVTKTQGCKKWAAACGARHHQRGPPGPSADKGLLERVSVSQSPSPTPANTSHTQPSPAKSVPHDIHRPSACARTTVPGSALHPLAA